MSRDKLSKIVKYLVIFIFVLNFLADKFYWYSSIWYFDMPMHFLGGLWIGLFFVYAFASESFRLSLESKALTGIVLTVILFVLIVGIGWEIFEFIFNNYLVPDPFNLLDTISDVFFDISGGFCAILYLWKKQLN